MIPVEVYFKSLSYWCQMTLFLCCSICLPPCLDFSQSLLFSPLLYLNDTVIVGVPLTVHQLLLHCRTRIISPCYHTIGDNRDCVVMPGLTLHHHVQSGETISLINLTNQQTWSVYLLCSLPLMKWCCCLIWMVLTVMSNYYNYYNIV